MQVVAPTIVAEAPVAPVKPAVPDINEQAAQLLDAAAKHLEEKGWTQGWGYRGGRTCIIGAMQEVLFVARGWDYDLGQNFTDGRFNGDPVARKAFEALRFNRTDAAILWNDSLSASRGDRTVIKRLREGADRLRGIIDSATWTG